MKTTKAVRKVQAVLRHGVPVHRIGTYALCAYAANRDLIVLLPGGRWAGLCSNEDACRIDVAIAGLYNNKVYTVLHAVEKFGLITSQEHQEFRDWLYSTEEELKRVLDLEKAEQLAQSLGYKLVKVEKAK